MGSGTWLRNPFPDTGQTVQQLRPVLVVTVPDAPGRAGLFWVLMVTIIADYG